MNESADSSAASLRGPRKDAVRNDAIVVAAARAVFAEQGPQASMESIAARAGLGVGTIYRRFPGKEMLLDAIARLFAVELDDAAARALQNPNPDSGLEEFLEFVGVITAENHRFAAALVDRAADDDVAARTGEKVRQLTLHAVDGGALGPTVIAEDVKALIIALRAVIARIPDDPGWRRFLHIHLTGLRIGP
ncbi:TetR/AcrR family transcriptional regulator [Curtobacterium sp. 18060]|uniref:TetR/AcrR family transcriptional regulator n=1 Tax=Curtobacterium sp. 18060 TaxID=2681408 RepID=UPI001359B0EF|nr:TetR/AcrR family transcriptional regulator [Curtobacterium sp. 18060]